MPAPSTSRCSSDWCRPVWIRPDIDEQTGLTAGMPVGRVAEALKAHPDTKAVLLVEPSYVGGVSDVAAHADLVHAHGIPLAVDAAWGAHLGFYPVLPPRAIHAGADILVTSIHKQVTGPTQSSMVLTHGKRIGRIAAEAAVPYPPGVPALAPGERIHASTLAALPAEAKRGTRIAYCGDPMRERVLVVCE